MPTRRPVETEPPRDENGGKVRAGVASALVALPPFALLLLILSYGVNMPYFDEWDLAPLVAKVATGDATIHDYHEQHGVHRIFVPKLVLSNLAAITGWNVRIELLLNLVLVTGTFVGMLAIIRRERLASETDRSLALLTTSVLLFAFAPVDSWLSGWHLGWFLANACLLWSLVLLLIVRLPLVLRFAGASVLCLIASFSIAHGVGSWIALFPAVLYAADHRRRWRFGAAWFLLFIMTLVVYFHGYEPNHPELRGSATTQVIKGGLYFFTIIGAPLSNVLWLAVPIGLIVSLLVVRLAWARLTNHATISTIACVSIVLYVFAFAAANTLGRAGWGLERALSAPYKVASALILVALIQLLIPRASAPPARRRTFRWAAALIISATVVGSLTVIPIAQQQRDLRTDARICLESALLISPDTRPACRPAIAWEYLDPVEEARKLHAAGVFDLPTSDSFSEREPSEGSIDAASSGWTDRPGATLVVRGFVESGARSRSLIALTSDRKIPLLATTLVSHPEGRRVSWEIDLGRGHAPEGEIEAWLYDPQNSTLLRLAGRWRPIQNR